MTDLLRVDLRCPACGYVWHAASIRPDSWWGKKGPGNTSSPEQVAKQCYCPMCECRPPIQVVTALPLFA